MQRSYLSWNWMGIQNLDRNRVAISKLAKGAPFWANYIFFELKKYRGVTFHETEERFKIWREIDLSFQKWHKEFDKFWCEHSKVSNILMRSFWAKYILFELKKYGEVIFHETKEGYKIWTGIGLWFQNWHKEFDKFWPETQKSQKFSL